MTTYRTCPMSIDGHSGYALQRDHEGTVMFYSGGYENIKLYSLTVATEMIETLEYFLPLLGPAHHWVERDGAHADSKKPMGYRPMAAARYLPAGRHHKGYPEIVVVADLSESVHILQQVNHTHKVNPLRSVSMR